MKISRPGSCQRVIKASGMLIHKISTIGAEKGPKQADYSNVNNNDSEGYTNHRPNIRYFNGLCTDSPKTGCIVPASIIVLLLLSGLALRVVRGAVKMERRDGKRSIAVKNKAGIASPSRPQAALNRETNQSGFPARGLSRAQKKKARRRLLGVIPESTPIMVRAAGAIHARANKLTGPSMFAVVDRFAGSCSPGQMGAEYASAAHECGCALREEAGVPEFGKRCKSQWQFAINDWQCGH